MDVDRNRVAIAHRVIDRVALDHRQADVDGIAVEDPGEAAGDDRLDSRGFDRHRGVLARAAATEITAADDHIARLHACGEVRPSLDKAGLAERYWIRRHVEPARDDGVGRDAVSELEDPGHQLSPRGSAIIPANAEAAATAGLAR